MGKGAVGADKSSYENKVSTHGQPLIGSRRLYRRHHPELRRKPGRSVPDLPRSSGTICQTCQRIGSNRCGTLCGQSTNGRKLTRNLAAKMDLWFSGKAPVIDWKAIEQKANQATRAASATVLGVLATQVENMIVSSADLSNSDKTDGFLKEDPCIRERRFQRCIPSKPVLPS